MNYETSCLYESSQILEVGAAGLVSTLGGYAAELAEQKKRVGMIGCGWRQCDLLRLVQSRRWSCLLCDVDKQMLTEAAEIVASRQLEEEARTYGDYRQMLKERILISSWWPRPTIGTRSP